MRIPMRAGYRLAVAGPGLAALTLLPALGLAAVPVEKTLPETTFAFAKAESVAKLRAAFQSSQMGRLLVDPALKDLKQDLAAKFDSTTKKVAEAVGMTPAELAELPQGPASIALVSLDNEKTPVAVLLSADAGANDKKMDEVFVRATAKAEKDGGGVTTETFQGSKLTVIRSPKADDNDEPPLIWTRRGGTFHVASDLGVLKDLLTHADGRDGSLADSANYQAIQKKLGRDAQTTWFVDLTRAIKLLTLAAAAQGGNAEQIVAQLQLTGLNGLKGLGGTLAFNVDHFDLLSKIVLSAPRPAQGLLKIASLPPANLRPQPWVPASVASYQSFSWDLDNAYVAVKELLDMFLPGQIEAMEKQISGADGAPLSFQNDVFGPIGNRITIISDFKKPITEKSERALFAVALEDQKGFQATFHRILSLAKIIPQKREFQGTTIYDFDASGLTMPGGDAPLKGPISVAIAKQSVFITTAVSLLEQVLRPGGPSLADNPEFQAVARHFPEATSTLSFQRPEESARLLYDIVKSGQLGKALEGAKTPDGGDLKKLGEAIDPAKLPEFSVFTKYLTPGGGFGLTDDDGAVFTQFTLKKPTP